MGSHYDIDINPDRPNNSHSYVFQLVGSGKRVLELGAASGYVSEVLRARGNHVTAVEYDAACRSELSARADVVLITDLDWLTFTHQLKGQLFDVVIAGDVLEHLVRPDLVLHQIKELLHPDGFVVITIPNIAHGDVRLRLLYGDFPYSEHGLLDKTHLHFFTRASAKELVESNGYELHEIYATTTPIGTTELGVDLERYDSEVLKAISDDPDSTVYQFVIKAKPKQMLTPPSEATRENLQELTHQQLMAKVSALDSALRLARNEVVQLGSNSRKLEIEAEQRFRAIKHDLELKSEELVSQVREHNLIQLEYRDSVIGLLTELGEARARLQSVEVARHEATELLRVEMTRAFNAESQIVKLQKQMNEIRNTWTWRLGRLVLAPVRMIKRLMS